MTIGQFILFLLRYSINSRLRVRNAYDTQDGVVMVIQLDGYPPAAAKDVLKEEDKNWLKAIGVRA